MRTALLCAALVLTLAACSALPSLPPSTSETAKPRSTRTHRPTKTPQPTETPTAFPSATPQLAFSLVPSVPPPLPSAPPPPTILPASPAPTPLPPSALDCDLVWQSPPNGALYDTGEKFSVGWNLKNVGTSAWEPGSFRFVYLGGAKLAPGGEIPLAQSVANGASVVLSVPMRAPWHPGIYTTHWGIRQAENFFCRLTLTIRVQAP